MPRLRVLALALVLAACDPVAPSPIDDVVVLDVREARPVGPQVAAPEPRLALSTEQAFGCLGWQIAHTVRRRGSRLTVSVEGVRPPQGDLCLAALGPATAAVPLADLRPGTYELVIENGGPNTYALEIAADRLVLTPGATPTTRAATGLTWRYPDRSFGYFCGTYTGDGALCDTFRDRLEAEIPLTRLDVPDEGEWPYRLAASGYYVQPPADFYRYETEADFDRAKGLLRAFAHETLRGRLGAGLSLEAWDGDVGYSWVYANEPAD